MYHLGPGGATPKSKKLSRGNPGTPLDFFARCGIVGLVESVRDTDRANGHSNGTDTKMTTSTLPLGAVLLTAGAAETLPTADIYKALRRHASGDDGDDGDICDEDRAANRDARKYGDRVLSCYRTEDRTKFWVLTEADRSATTVLLPEEY